MTDKNKTKAQLISELKELRARIAALNELEFKHKLAEQSLLESEERFRHLSEAAFEAIVIHKEGVILQANEQYYQLFGYEPEELEGINAIPLTATAESALFMKEQIALGNLGPYEVVGLRKDGTTFPMEIRTKFMEYRGSKVRMAAIRDLTEQRQAKEALRASNEMFEKTFRSQMDALFILDENNPPKIRDCNPSATRVFGYSRKEMLGRTTDFLHVNKTKRRDFQKHLYPEIAKQAYFHLPEFNMKRNDGTVFPSEHTVVSLVNDQGKRIGWVSVVRDISERKRMVEELRESEHYFRSLLFNMHDKILVVDPDCRITDANNTLLVAVGRKFEEVVGLHCYEVSHGYNEPCYKKGEDCKLREVFETGEPRSCRHQHRRANGSKSWVDILLSPLRNENGIVTHVIEAIRNVTDLIEIEGELRESEENFRALADNANDGILIAAGEGIHVYANKRLAEITGFSVAELLKIGLRELVAGDEVDKVADRYKRRISGKEASPHYETAFVRKSGEIFPVELSCARTVWRGEPASIVIIRDITLKKERELALRKSEAKLLEKTRHLEEVNAALKVLLKRREQDKEELSENVLSNVRQLVFPYLEKLKRSQLDTRQTTLVDILESNMNEIVSPFVTKLSSKFMNLTPTEIKVASLIRDGRTTKEIAALLRLSENTIVFHRHNIRSKLQLKNKKVNLRSYLKSLRQ